MLKWLVGIWALCISLMASAQCLFDSASCRPDAFYVNMDGRDSVAVWQTADRKYSASLYGVICEMTLRDSSGCRIMDISLTNTAGVPFQPVKAGLKLGVDTYMDRYPEWLDKFFPTLLFCEKTHFYGYFQSPSGKMLGIASPDPVASWSLDYNLGYPEPEPYWFWGHRIEAVNIDLMNALPLPERHPQDLWSLAPGETRAWRLYGIIGNGCDAVSHQADRGSVQPVQETFEQVMSRTAGIPMITMERTSYAPDETAVWKSYINGRECVHKTELAGPGLYPLSVISDGMTATAMACVHPSWEWTMRKARENVLVAHQKATSHVESWYGFYSGFLAARYFPDDSLDSAVNSRFDFIMDLLYGPDRSEPKYYAWRIQNTASTIGMFTDRFEAFGNVADLETAARLADWMTGFSQTADGAYMNGKTVYTSVIYVAKSVLELAAAEKMHAQALLAGKSPDAEYAGAGKDGQNPADARKWKESARRHFGSAKHAIDQLVSVHGNFNTEGEITFEDGMVSCSALQIGQLAVMLDDFTGTDADGFAWNISSAHEADSLRTLYTEELVSLLRTHDCLTQLRIPDARRRGGTMRFWEAQYDVNMMPNMISSPHGWSAWRAYATYYAYLLTRDIRWLVETFNAAGAFSQLLDIDSGRLFWAFVVDPYVQAKQIDRPLPGKNFDSVNLGNAHPDMYGYRKITAGEEYVPMVSSWQPFNTCDNDVHEVFKFIAEAVLTNAFVAERPDGGILAYNCSVVRKGRNLFVTPSEPQIRSLYVSVSPDLRINPAEGLAIGHFPGDSSPQPTVSPEDIR